MKLLDLMSYIYFGSPKYWNGLPVDKRKRLFIRSTCIILGVAIFSALGIKMLIGQFIVSGIFLLLLALVGIFSFIKIRKSSRKL